MTIVPRSRQELIGIFLEVTSFALLMSGTSCIKKSVRRGDRNINGHDAAPIQLAEEYERNPNRPNPKMLGEATVAKLRTVMAAAQQNSEDQVYKQRAPRATYKEADKVLLKLKIFPMDRPCKKLDWLHAKYTVTKPFPSSLVYGVDVPRGVHGKSHASLFRPAVADPSPFQECDDPQLPPIINIDSGEEWVVKEILRAKWVRQGKRHRRKVLIKWIGFAESIWS